MKRSTSDCWRIRSAKKDIDFKNFAMVEWTEHAPAPAVSELRWPAPAPEVIPVRSPVPKLGLLLLMLASRGVFGAEGLPEPGKSPQATRTTPLLAERLRPQSKLFGAQLIKFSPSKNDDIQQQFIRKNLVQVKDSYGAHIEILDSYIQDSQFKATAKDRLATLSRWITSFEKEKALPDSVLTFDRLYLRLRQVALDFPAGGAAVPALAGLEKDIEAFTRSEPKLPWSQFLAGLVRQVSDAFNQKSTLEKEKEYYFNQASMAAVDDAPFHFLLGQVYLDYYDRTDVSNFLKLIATEFEKCLLIDSSHSNKELWSSITAIYVDVHEEYQKKDVSEPFWFEELVYKRIIKLDPTNASAHNNLSFLYSQNGVNLKEALKEAQIADRLTPNNPYLLDSLGWAYYKNKQLGSALDVLKRAAKLKDDIADVHFHLATVYFDRDDFQNASTEFKETIRLQPENAFAKNNLAYLYAEKGQFLDDALKLVDEALAKFADNAAFIDTKGWIYFKQKKFDLSVETLRKAIDLMPETSDLHMHLGTVFLTIGKFQEAGSHFEKALTYDPTNAQIAKDLSYTYALQGIETSLERYRKIAGVDRAKENFKVFYDLLSHVHQAKNDYAGAAAKLEEYRALQSREEPEKEDHDSEGTPDDDSGTHDKTPEASPSISPSAAPSAAPSSQPSLAPGLLSFNTPKLIETAARFPAATEVFMSLEKQMIARLIDFTVDQARSQGHAMLVPRGAMVAAAVDRVCFGISLKTLKSPGRSCGLAAIQLSPPAAIALRHHVANFGEGQRSFNGPMGLWITVSSTLYKTHRIYQITLPQGSVYVIMVENQAILGCQKSDLVNVVDGLGDPKWGLNEQPLFSTVANHSEGKDVVIFCRTTGLPASEITVPAKLNSTLLMTQALGSLLTLGQHDDVSEESYIFPVATQKSDAVRQAFEEMSKELQGSFQSRFSGRVKVSSEFKSEEGFTRGTVKLDRVSALVTELYSLFRKQMGQDANPFRSK
jgi:Flp pilus assembly protein TadD